MLPAPLVQLIVAASATIVAAAAIGVYHRTGQILDQVKQHNRVLFGEEAVDGWDGIVPKVERHDDILDDLADE